MKKLVQGCYDTAAAIIEEHSDALVKIAEALLEREILDGNEVMQIINGQSLPPMPRVRTRRTIRSRCCGRKAAAACRDSRKASARSRRDPDDADVSRSIFSTSTARCSIRREISAAPCSRCWPPRTAPPVYLRFSEGLYRPAPDRSVRRPLSRITTPRRSTS